MKLATLGVSMQQRTYLTKWMPLQCALFYGNESTFDALAFHCVGAMLPLWGLKDSRGWGLLHLAAASGSRPLVKRLLELGLDPEARSDEASILLPGELKYKELTPRTVAQHYGHGTMYDEVMEAAGLNEKPGEPDFLVDLS